LNRVIWTDPALDHIEAIRAYIVQFNPRAAQRLADALVAEGDTLAMFPNRGRPIQGTKMRELVTSYPYVIRFEVAGDDVVILRVRHTSRRPTSP
jgi:plasmid stabilization system protein ParE